VAALVVSALVVSFPACDLKNLSEALSMEQYVTAPVPACTHYSWFVQPARCHWVHVSCENMFDLVPDLDASPPHVQMTVGEAAFVRLRAINGTPDGCALGGDPGQGFSFHSSHPAVARIDATATANDTVFKVTAEGVGEAQIYADNVNTPSGPVRVTLAYCPDERWPCRPVDLTLRVFP
jgi:hypothetical protein